eukprot:TRINITY_DN8469_c0_g1_i11.p1 TRINITY_DN8469_c0_g1~~TRINITY_DN8469_c0_g1_i11.p1  ORF type:complete len:229 (-),score=44.65 TRINITY_DN8469_c0_g1_i11:134-820(-)
MKCRCTSDCAAGHFCSNVDGIKQCMRASEVGGRCRDDEVCVGNALCHFERVSDLSGKCVEFLSLKSRTDLKIILKIKGIDVSSVADIENLLCESGYVDMSGRCAVPTRKAINKGGLCHSDNDCSTTTTEPGNCVASLTESAKYCAPLEADDEWQDAFKAFAEYYRAAKKELRYSKWHPHAHEELYRRMKCAVYKAFYYALRLDYERSDEMTKKRLRSIPVLEWMLTEC